MKLKNIIYKIVISFVLFALLMSVGKIYQALLWLFNDGPLIIKLTSMVAVICATHTILNEKYPRWLEVLVVCCLTALFIYWMNLAIGVFNAPMLQQIEFFLDVAAMFLAGLFFKGETNKRIVFLYASAYTISMALYLFLAMSVIKFPYLVALCPAVTAFIGVYFFSRYNGIQCKLIDLLDFMRVPQAYTDKIAGRVESTNFLLMMIFYWRVGMILDLLFGLSFIGYGIYYGTPFMGEHIHLNMINELYEFKLLGLSLSFNALELVMGVYSFAVGIVGLIFNFYVLITIPIDRKKPDLSGSGFIAHYKHSNV